MKKAEELLKEKGVTPETMCHNSDYVFRAVYDVIEQAQKEAYNQALEDAAKSAVAEIELQKLINLQKMKKEQKSNNSIETDILPMKCYVPFFVKDIDDIRHLFPWQSRQPQWLKEYLLLIKTRRGNKHYVVKGLSFVGKFSVKGFSKFKVIGWRDLP